MQDRPDKATLMEAVARFLTEEVRPHVTNKATSFRVLVAANLAGIVAREIRMEDAHDAAQLDRLKVLLPDVDVSEAAQSVGRTARHEALAALNKGLVQQLREGGMDEGRRAAVYSHVTQTLREKLAVINPRFDQSPHVES